MKPELADLLRLHGVDPHAIEAEVEHLAPPARAVGHGLTSEPVTAEPPVSYTRLPTRPALRLDQHDYRPSEVEVAYGHLSRSLNGASSHLGERGAVLDGPDGPVAISVDAGGHVTICWYTLTASLRPLDALAGGLTPAAWLRDEVDALIAHGGAAQVQAWGLVARLFDADGDPGEWLRRARAGDGPRARLAAQVPAIEHLLQAAEAHAVALTDSLRGDLSDAFALGAERARGAPEMLRWICRARDACSCTETVLRAAGRGTPLTAALAALDRDVAAEVTALEDIGVAPDARLQAVAASDPLAWWGWGQP